MKLWAYIKGAIESKVGDEGICIAFSSNPPEEHFNYVEVLDAQFKPFIDSLDKVYEQVSPAMVSWGVVDNVPYLQVVRGQKYFTPFPGQQRAYHRREFYLVEQAGEMNPLAFRLFFRLPVMERFDRYRDDYQPVLLDEQAVDVGAGSLFFNLFFQDYFSKGQPLVVKRETDTDNRLLLELLCRLPAVYQRQIRGIGFNLPAQNPYKAGLQAFTTVDEGYDSLQALAQCNLSDAATHICTAIVEDPQYYGSEEIDAAGQGLLELATYHSLKYYLRHRPIHFLPGHDARWMKQQAQQYLSAFLRKEWSGRSSIAATIGTAIDYIRQELPSHSEDYFEWVWELFGTSQLTVDEFAAFFGDEVRQIEAYATAIVAKHDSIKSLIDRYGKFAIVQVKPGATITDCLKAAFLLQKSSIAQKELLQVGPTTLKILGDNQKREIIQKCTFQEQDTSPADTSYILEHWGIYMEYGQIQQLLEHVSNEALYRMAMEGKNWFFNNKAVCNYVEAKIEYKPDLQEKGLSLLLNWAKLLQKERITPRFGDKDILRHYYEKSFQPLLNTPNEALDNINVAQKLWQEFKKQELLNAFAEEYILQPSAAKAMEYLKNNRIIIKLDKKFLEVASLGDYIAKDSAATQYKDIIQPENIRARLFKKVIGDYKTNQFSKSDDKRFEDYVKEHYPEKKNQLKKEQKKEEPEPKVKELLPPQHDVPQLPVAIGMEVSTITKQKAFKQVWGKLRNFVLNANTAWIFWLLLFGGGYVTHYRTSTPSTTAKDSVKIGEDPRTELIENANPPLPPRSDSFWVYSTKKAVIDSIKWSGGILFRKDSLKSKRDTFSDEPKYVLMVIDPKKIKTGTAPNPPSNNDTVKSFNSNNDAPTTQLEPTAGTLRPNTPSVRKAPSDKNSTSSQNDMPKPSSKSNKPNKPSYNFNRQNRRPSKDSINR